MSPFLLSFPGLFPVFSRAWLDDSVLTNWIGWGSISGTSSGKEKAVVASLSCSPDGRCSNVNVNGITVTYAGSLQYVTLADLSFVT